MLDELERTIKSVAAPRKGVREVVQNRRIISFDRNRSLECSIALVSSTHPLVDSRDGRPRLSVVLIDVQGATDPGDCAVVAATLCVEHPRQIWYPVIVDVSFDIGHDHT